MALLPVKHDLVSITEQQHINILNRCTYNSFITHRNGLLSYTPRFDGCGVTDNIANTGFLLDMAQSWLLGRIACTECKDAASCSATKPE